MSIGLLVVSLIVLFLILAQGANLLVENIKLLANRWRLNIFFIGLILGLFTSMPEFMLSLSNSQNGLGNVSLGNLLGGVLVLFGLVLGAAIVFNRQIKTDGQITSVLPSILLFLLPLILGLKGWLNHWDGLAMIMAYLAVACRDFRHHRRSVIKALPSSRQQRLAAYCQKLNPRKLLGNRHLWLAVVGFGVIVGASHLITGLSTKLLDQLHLSQLLIGVVIFSIGTNLPEIAVTFRALTNRAGELSISHLLGSAISNVLIIGILLQFVQLSTQPLWSYAVVGMAICLLSGLFLIFYRTDKCFRRWEGVVLLAVYLAFLASQFIWAV